ncbi:hypothetical protein GIB67_009096 [Kingdonia uniflora]|uniref:Uncharacterized protein n=1 Tax=Kingdonia uniflora TaxID=39325 RepID=A0A7J7N3N4_9MAGN|nr:hypothetical protein GIB67_009096 [Kingdonia uniflora]
MSSKAIKSQDQCSIQIVTAFSSHARILKILDRTQDGPHRKNICQACYRTAKALFQTFLILVSTKRAIADACSMTTDLTKGSNAIRSVFAVLDRITKIDPQQLEDNQDEKKLVRQVKLCDVHFAYPARPDVIILKRFHS